MDRKTLEKQIRTLDEQLAVELALLKLDGREWRAVLGRVPPLVWVGVSILGGLLVGRLAGSNGSRLLISQGGNLLRFAGLLMPGLLVAGRQPE